MTSELDAAALGEPQKLFAIEMRYKSLQLEVAGDGLEICMDDGSELVDLVLDPTQVRDLILALQQWLATKEGLG